ncbi:TPA: hypothetical protein ACH3X3_001050 [Trebouxia sp. C0006]
MSRNSLRGSLLSVNASAWLAVVGLPLVLAIGMFAACWTGVSQHSTCSLLPSYNSPISGRVIDLPPVNSRKWKPWLKSHKIRVAALIFYGRREYVRILNGYVKQNLLKNGGVLEEVVWIVQTDNKRDIAWLNNVLLPSEPEFYSTKSVAGKNYTEQYQSLDPDVYYVKLDDDTMYVGEQAVDMMLHEKLRDRFFIVSANVINHSVLTWIHAGMGAMHTHKNDGGREILGNDYDDLLMRYLEVKPFANFTYGPLEKCSLTSLECASLCHFYFLENQANNQLERYNFHFWDFHAFSYNRWSINAILFKGSDLNNELMDPNISDEVLISWTLPQKLDRHCGAVGSALVVHLAYGMQRDAGIGETGIVQHYEHLAAKLTGRLLPR